MLLFSLNHPLINKNHCSHARRIVFILSMSQPPFISNQPVVIDNGTGMIKAGLAGVDIPGCEIRSYVGSPKYDHVIVSDDIPDSGWYEFCDESDR